MTRVNCDGRSLSGLLILPSPSISLRSSLSLPPPVSPTSSRKPPSLSSPLREQAEDEAEVERDEEDEEEEVMVVFVEVEGQEVMDGEMVVEDPDTEGEMVEQEVEEEDDENGGEKEFAPDTEGETEVEEEEMEVAGTDVVESCEGVEEGGVEGGGGKGVRMMDLSSLRQGRR